MSIVDLECFTPHTRRFKRHGAILDIHSLKPGTIVRCGGCGGLFDFDFHDGYDPQFVSISQWRVNWRERRHNRGLLPTSFSPEALRAAHQELNSLEEPTDA